MKDVLSNYATFYDVAESPDVQASPMGQVRWKDSGVAILPREDARGREVVVLGGTTYVVTELTRLGVAA